MDSVAEDSVVVVDWGVEGSETAAAEAAAAGSAAVDCKNEDKRKKAKS